MSPEARVPWLLLSIALAQDPVPLPPTEPPPPDPVEAPVPVTGLADLHLHQWAELAYAGRWYFGEASGPPAMALGECGEVMEHPRVPRRVQHGVILPVSGPAELVVRPLAYRALQDERSDDLRPKHPPAAISTAGSLPHWLGWPTSDSLAHQQSWEGWLRLAHDGIPALWWLDQQGDDAFVHAALDDFYADYEANMGDAARAGAVGLNLVVVSLVHNNLLCRQQVSRKARRDTPSICNDMDAIHRQYQAAVAWADRHGDWARIVTTPQEASQAIQEGKLAIVLSLESSDVFGPSETIGYGSPFADGYIGRARRLGDRLGIARKEAVRRALGHYLDELPLVSTVQLAHQYDSPFAGAAYINATFVKQQQWRDRHPHRIRNDDDDGWLRCKDEAATWKWEGERSRHPECQAALSTEHTGSPSTSGLFRLFENAPPAHALPKAYRKRSPTRPYTNPYGLSEDGEVLAEVLASRGVLIDTSHLSRAALADLRDLDLGVPMYSSHAYPQQSNLLLREQNLTADDLGMMRLVGVRPGDDEATTGEAPAGSPFAETLGRADCQGTSVVSGLHLETAAAAGPAVTYGSDLNGFINQPTGTGVVRPPIWGGAPCSAAVPSIGSEVAHRGLAHVGLLPQLHMEAMAAAGDDADRVEGPLRGVEAFLSMWREARCAAGHDGDCGAVAAADVVPWEGWREWVYDEEGELATAQVVLPYTRPPRAGRGLDDDAPMGITRVRPKARATPLPRLRALEATLPYWGPSAASSRVLAQLPTRLGFLVGAYSTTATRERWHFPVTRCERSGWHGLTEAGDRQRQRELCDPLREARQAYMSGLRRRTDTNHMLQVWDRLYPGPLTDGDDARSLQHRLGLLADAPGSAWHDLPAYPLTVARLLADDARCLDAPGLLDAPPVGLTAGQAPSDWLAEVKSVTARDCYCALLKDLEEAELLVPRDREGLRACGL